MKDIPSIIQNELNENSTYNWLEEHDRLEVRGKSYDEKNQYDWWVKNNRIRIALQEIEKEVNEELEKGNPVSIRNISNSRIAKIAKCDRGTITHTKRAKWIKGWKQQLETIIKNSQLLNEKKDDKVSQENELKFIKEQLKRSRIECANWVKKSIELEEKNTQLQKKMYYIEEALSKRNTEIRELKQFNKSFNKGSKF